MLHSAIDIVAISTGRETLLIGPSSAFGANARAQLIRDRVRLRRTLETFMMRPGAVELVRPHLRRWGLHSALSRLSEKETVKDALLRAAAAGQLAIAAVPEVTLAFSGAHAAGGDPMAQIHLGQRASADIFPDAIEERLILVIEMVPGHMTGATRQAFEQTLASTGIAVIAGGLMTWLGVHLVPGANVAVLAFDLFFLGSDVIRACETIGKTMQQVADARSRADLEPAAVVMAGAIATLIVAGVFRRLMKAKQVTKGPGREGGQRSIDKPGSGPKEARVVREPRRPSVTSETHVRESPAQTSRPAAPPTPAAPTPPSPPEPPDLPLLVEKYQRPDGASLSNVDARKWYKAQEALIPRIIDRNASLETQARQAFNFRNEIRIAARDAMSDRDAAAKLMREERNITWQELVEKKRKEGFTGDDIYREIINSSQKSRKSVNDKLGL